MKLQILNFTGQLVRTLVNADLEPGVHVQRWNSRGQDGRQAASGVYLYRLQIGPKIWHSQIVMIK